MIRKGEDWGQRAPLPTGQPVIGSNEDLHQFLQEARREERSLPLAPIGLLGGDLCKTLGGAGRRDRLETDEAFTLPCDLIEADLDGKRWWFAAHLIARSTWLTGQLTFLMNGAWRGDWNVAPRAHPGDGRFDIVDTTMSATKRLQGWRRVAHGGHVPHPEITMRKAKHYSSDQDTGPRGVLLDGVAVGRARKIDVRVHDGALPVVV